MAKLPFGGVWDDVSDPPVDQTDDPAPLLAEIAKCAEDAIPMRPQLAAWFYHVWQSQRIQIRTASGRPGLETSTRVVEAYFRIRKLESHGVARDTAVERVREELGLKVSRTAVYGWLKKIADFDRKQFEELQEELWERAASRLRNLAASGTSDEEAVRIVYDELIDTEAQHTPEQLRAIQRFILD